MFLGDFIESSFGRVVGEEQGSNTMGWSEKAETTEYRGYSLEEFAVKGEVGAEKWVPAGGQEFRSFF